MPPNTSGEPVDPGDGDDGSGDDGSGGGSRSVGAGALVTSLPSTGTGDGTPAGALMVLLAGAMLVVSGVSLAIGKRRT